MKALFDGIYSQFTGSTEAGTPYVLTEGKLYPSEAPQGTAYPYGVYHLISDVPDYTFETTVTIENALVQFNLYDDDNSAVDISEIYTAYADLYDWCSLTLTGYSSVYMKREYSYLTKDENLWDYMIQYRIVFQKG